jgi:hypothetical protein
VICLDGEGMNMTMTVQTVFYQEDKPIPYTAISHV